MHARGLAIHVALLVALPLALAEDTVRTKEGALHRGRLDFRPYHCLVSPASGKPVQLPWDQVAEIEQALEADQPGQASPEEDARAREVLRKNPYDRAALVLWKRIHDRYRPKRAYHFPLQGAWLAVKDTTGHHRMKAFAYYAIDFLRAGGAASFGAPVLAAGDGTVIQAEHGFRDLPRGVLGKFNEGNYLVIDHGEGEKSFYAHLQQGSVSAAVGSQVKAGQPVAKVGNSGASGTPHLHFTIIDRDHLSVPWRVSSARWMLGEGRVVTVKGAKIREGATYASLEP